MIRRTLVPGALAVGLVLSGSACSPDPTPSGGGVSDGAPNLLMIVIDTLRADRLGCYGSGRDTSPSIDALAASGVRFERAYSTAPWTIPSVASMITGHYPSRHATTSFDRRLPDDVTTLAEMLSGAGYATAGVVSHTAIDTRHNFDQGFEVYMETEAQGHDHLSTPGVTGQALEQLEALAADGRPFFLFVHFFDPHYNYLHHPDIGFASPPAGRLRGDEPMREMLRLADSMTSEEVTLLRDLYDEEIRYTDAGIGRLLERLEAAGLASNTVVALTADHGEEFLEHGFLGHTGTLYQELVHVPLILRDPRSVARGVRRAPVSLVSLTPTLLELLDVEVEQEFHGHSIADRLVDDSAVSVDETTVFCEVDFVPVRPGRSVGEVHKKALLFGSDPRYKLIRDDRTGTVELYDLTADPGETTDLAARESELRTAWEAQLDAWVARARENALEPEMRDVDDAEVERLKSLGYVGE